MKQGLETHEFSWCGCGRLDVMNINRYLSIVSVTAEDACGSCRCIAITTNWQQRPPHTV